MSETVNIQALALVLNVSFGLDSDTSMLYNLEQMKNIVEYQFL